MTGRDSPPNGRALKALAQTWNRLDPGVIEPWLAEDISYESLDTELLLEGKSTVLDHLTRKVELIDRVGEDARLRVQLGSIRAVDGSPRPCLISSQGAVQRAALFFVTVGANGLIERILLSTRDPDPREATESGVYPE